MKINRIIVILIISVILEGVLTVLTVGRISDTKQDPVKVNECVRSVELNYGDTGSYSRALDYVVTDEDGMVLFRTKEGLPETLNEAIIDQCLIMDYEIENESSDHAENASGNPADIARGKIIFENTLGDRLSVYRNRLFAAIAIIMVIQFAIIFAWLFYIRKSVIRPFEDLNDFAVRVASGNLDVPLRMDKGHIFGGFTEAFDLMRSELRKARAAERKANEEKKEIVAKLSHDIKTPVASIKSTSEVGLVTAGDDKTREMFGQINAKTDQIKTLVDNLFNSSVQELTEISVNPSPQNSSVIKELIRNADYLGRVGDYDIPDARVYIDRLRLQQAFDNIFLNSYKYADTAISVSSVIEGEFLLIKISDMGPGVSDEELTLLKGKYRRGANSADKDGAGLGLYLTDYYIEEMDGFLTLQNEHPGFSVSLHLRLI